MPFSTEQITELEVLLHYKVDNSLEGIKVHSSAAPEIIAATKRLHDKGLITLEDGGYLTDLGHQAVEHAYSLITMLASVEHVT